MREIKFRGKRLDDTIHNGSWVYGHYFIAPLTDENSGMPAESGWFFLSGGERRHCIEQDGVVYTVDPATVGQFTGLRDDNDVEIYEDDILRFHRAGWLTNPICTVEFKDGAFYTRSHSDGYDDEYMVIRKSVLKRGSETPLFDQPRQD